MGVTALVKRLFGRCAGVRVAGVEFEEHGGEEQIVVHLARGERRRMRCAGCGFRTQATYDRAVRRWRHLDLMRTRCVLSCEVRRIDCPTCGVVAEDVPWARPAARFTRAFEDTCVWLGRDAPKSVVASLMRVDWATVGRMIERVVDEAVGACDGLDGLSAIGIDEVAYRKGHRYLTVVVDHVRGAVVWCGEGRSAATLEKFFGDLGPERSALITAASCDMSPSWPAVVKNHAPQARLCIDPFHVIKLSSEALDRLRRDEWQRLRREDPEAAKWIKGTRFTLLRRPEDLDERARLCLDDLKEHNADIYAGYLLHDQLRAIYALTDPLQQADMLDRWIVMAAESGLAPFVKLASTIDHNYDGIVAAMELGISNARLEAMNSTVRLISHRSRGFRRLDSLLAMIRLTCGSIPLCLPQAADLLGGRITHGYT